MLRTVRLMLWGLVGIAAVIGVILLVRGERRAAPEPTIVSELGGPFTLKASDGKPFASERLAGRPHAIFFGFTHCPDVCPNTLARLAKLRRDLGQGEDAFDIVLISVDPDRDTPKEMARYAALFDTPLLALTGTNAEIDRVKQSYGVFSKKVPLDDGSYTVDHTATVFLFGRDGKFAGTIAPDEGDEPALQKLDNIVAG